MEMFSKEGRQLLEGATRWADGVCKLLDQQRRKGHYEMLAQTHPAVRSYFAECYTKTGPNYNAALWAALHPEYGAALLGIHHNYAMMGRLVEAVDPVKLSAMTLDELEGLVRYVEDQLQAKTQLQKHIAGLSPERLRDLLQRIQDDLQRRRKEDNAQQEGKAPTTGALTEALTGLKQEIRRNHGH
jgi:hypothetical protein